MKNLVKEFIEDNIVLIEEEDYDDLYDQAYEWLPDDYVTELTDILTKTLGVDFTQYAKQNILAHVNIEINNFVADNRHPDLTLATFVRMYMNHINGLDWDEFQLLVEKELKDSSLVKIYDDGAGDLHISTEVNL